MGRLKRIETTNQINTFPAFTSHDRSISLSNAAKASSSNTVGCAGVWDLGPVTRGERWILMGDFHQDQAPEIGNSWGHDGMYLEIYIYKLDR